MYIDILRARAVATFNLRKHGRTAERCLHNLRLESASGRSEKLAIAQRRQRTCARRLSDWRLQQTLLAHAAREQKMPCPRLSSTLAIITRGGDLLPGVCARARAVHAHVRKRAQMRGAFARRGHAPGAGRPLQCAPRCSPTPASQHAAPAARPAPAHAPARHHIAALPSTTT